MGEQHRKVRRAEQKNRRTPVHPHAGRPPLIHVCETCGSKHATAFQLNSHKNGAHLTAHPLKEIQHGTPSGYRLELKRGLNTCAACRTAWRAQCKRYYTDR